MLHPPSHRRPPSDETLISAVLPVFNECAVLERLHALLTTSLEALGSRYEIVFVNDGSSDGSGLLLDEIAARDPHVRVLHFSRNFGHQAAVQAGLLHAAGDAVIVMDSDLQDDPASLPVFVEQWRAGYDVVFAVRTKRKENLVKRVAFYGFYRCLNAISQIPIPNDAGNFSLVDRSVALRIAHLLDRDRYFPGLRCWVGFRQTGVPVERLARHDRYPRVSLRQLWRLAKTALFSFSGFPAALFYGLACLSLALGLGLTGFTLYHKLFTGLAIPGWASMTITTSFFGALNALGIGLLGEYVMRIYDQVRARPLFIVARKSNFDGTADIPAPLDWSYDNWSDTPSLVPALAQRERHLPR